MKGNMKLIYLEKSYNLEKFYFTVKPRLSGCLQFLLLKKKQIRDLQHGMELPPDLQCTIYNLLSKSLFKVPCSETLSTQPTNLTNYVLHVTKIKIIPHKLWRFQKNILDYSTEYRIVIIIIIMIIIKYLKKPLHYSLSNIIERIIK